MEELAQAVAISRRRLLAILLPMYILAFLDRTNIGFAKQAIQASTGLSEAAYALGAGLFFLTYGALEIPSSLILNRVGARRWLSRIMVTWGLASAAMMFARGPVSFYLLRIILGAAEAGFFPGVILYLTFWFPRAHISQVFGLFYFGAPLAFILGGPLSGLLLEMHGVAGLNGWQWMFLTEGLLASAVGVWAWFYLDDSPADATWLSANQRDALLSVLDRESQGKSAHHFGAAVFSPKVFLLGGIYLLIQMSVYGVVFYLPTHVAGLLGRSVGFVVGLVTAIPWICALGATYLVPRIAAGRQKHHSLAAAILAISALSIVASTTAHPVLGILALSIAAATFLGVQPLFWTLPVSYLGGAAAAGGIALINSLGTLGGFVAPNLRHWANVRFHSPKAGLYFLAAGAATAAMLILLFPSRGESSSKSEGPYPPDRDPPRQASVSQVRSPEVPAASSLTSKGGAV